MAIMFKFYTRAEVQLFSNKKEAIDFYTRGAKQSYGAERDRYLEYACALEDSYNEGAVEYEYCGQVRHVLNYDKKQDRLIVMM